METKPKQTTNDKGEVVHYSVGAIIAKDWKYLLIDRAKPPFGFAAPAGHVDEGEEPEIALVREVFEESGLKVKSFKLIDERVMSENLCSRGVPNHHWYLYSCEVEGDIVWNELETKSIGWYTPEEMRELPLEPAWRYWFEEQKII